MHEHENKPSSRWKLERWQVYGIWIAIGIYFVGAIIQGACALPAFQEGLGRLRQEEKVRQGK